MNLPGRMDSKHLSKVRRPRFMNVENIIANVQANDNVQTLFTDRKQCGSSMKVRRAHISNHDRVTVDER